MNCFGSSVVHGWSFVREGFGAGFRWLREHDGDAPQEVVWETRHKHVRRMVLPAEYGGPVAYKTYLNARTVRYFLQPSAAAREGRGFLVAESLGIPTVEVLAFGEERRWGDLKAAFFISRFLEGCSSGRALLRKDLDEDGRWRLREFISRNLEYLARLHKAGYRHGGAHYDNFIWKATGRRALDVLWLDLATVRRIPPFLFRLSRAADVGRFLGCFRLPRKESAGYLELYRAAFRDA